jgi:hypothetical protein
LFFVNHSGAVFWNLLQLTASPSLAIHELALHFGIEEKIAQRDLQGLTDLWKDSSDAVTSRQAPRDLDWRQALDLQVPDQIGRYQIGPAILTLQISGHAWQNELWPRISHLKLNDPTERALGTVDLFEQNGRFYAVYEGQAVVSEPEVNAARAALLPVLVRIANAKDEPNFILHAGACAYGDGSILFPAPSGYGKTTLIAALAKNFEVLTDDSAVVASFDGALIPMPFALMVREGSWSVLASRLPELLNLPILERDGCRVRFLPPRSTSSSHRAAPPRALIFPEFRDGSVAGCERIGSFEAFVRLEAAGFSVPHTYSALSRFVRWIDSLPAYAMTYSSLDCASRMVRDVVREQSCVPS